MKLYQIWSLLIACYLGTSAQGQEVTVDYLNISVPFGGVGLSGETKPRSASSTYGTEFPPTEVSQSLTRNFTITNVSGNKLTFHFNKRDESPAFSLSQTSTVLLPGTTTILGITFQPNEDGRFVDIIEITSQADPETPFYFQVKGATPLIEIELRDSEGELIVLGNVPSVENNTSFSGLRSGDTVTRDFTLTNTGTIDFPYQIEFAEEGELALRNPSDPTGILAPETSATFSVRLIPRNTGERQESLIIRHATSAALFSTTRNFKSEVEGRAEIGLMIIPEDGEPIPVGVRPTFADTKPRKESEPITIRVTNTGDAPMEDITLESQSEEFLLIGDAPESLDLGSSFDYEVVFRPLTFTVGGSALDKIREGGISLNYRNRIPASPATLLFRGTVVGGKLFVPALSPILAGVNRPRTFTVDLQNSAAASADLVISDLIFPQSPNFTFSFDKLPDPIPPGESRSMEITYLATRVLQELNPKPVIRFLNDGEGGDFSLVNTTIQTIPALSTSFAGIAFDPVGPNILLTAPSSEEVPTAVYYLSESHDLKTWTRRRQIFLQPNLPSIHTVNLTAEAPQKQYFRIEISRLGYP